MAGLGDRVRMGFIALSLWLRFLGSAVREMMGYWNICNSVDKELFALDLSYVSDLLFISAGDFSLGFNLQKV
ncbi:hypothetical protein J2T15_004109 [Paenibacillus harenae]|uniref:Uncharacterized protein n=1 Tax=Paenibacillus harenae TaxID=306543 RepID=A0ABT9U6J5_PAEHA|nr:hypothetical protein [Paenibacillus harenae]